MTKFTGFRLPHAKALREKNQRSKRQASSASCGVGFYKSPASQTTLASSSPLVISWDTSADYATCLGSPSQIDIYLQSPQVSGGKIQKFTPIPFSAGTYTRALDPKWWGDLSNIQAQIIITATGTPIFANTIAAGPVFNLTYDGTVSSAISNGSSTNATASGDPNIATSAGVVQRGTLQKGAIAAAVLLPIIAIAVALVMYIKASRAKQAEKTRRFTQNLDARMSRISGDWQSLGRAGAEAAIRGSTAGEMRMSRVFAQEMPVSVSGSTASLARPSLSVYSSQEAYGRPSGETVGTRQSRFGGAGIGERTSRISFAADVNASKDRLSTYSTGRASRAFHVSVVPPVPMPPAAVRMSSSETVYTMTTQAGHGHSDDGDHMFSPIQEEMEGPVALTREDIDVGPALRLMRTGAPAPLNTNTNGSHDELLLSPPPIGSATPLSPLGASAHAPPLSPVGMMPMQPLSISMMMSPDDMLRQYAEARAGGAKSPIAPPSPIYTGPMSLMSAMPESPTTGNGGSVAAGVPQYTEHGMRNLTGDASLSTPVEHGYHQEYAGQEYPFGKH